MIAQRESAWSQAAFPLVPLGKTLERRVEFFDREKNPLRPAHFISLRFDGTVEPRALHGKTDFRGTLFLANSGDLVFSKIDLRNGAIGLVPTSIPAAAVTSEFPVYRVKPEALPEYLVLLIRSSTFREAVNALVSGTSGRKRVTPVAFEGLRVPLPPLATQRAIVAWWQKAQADIAAARARAEASETQARASFLAGLRLREPSAISTRKAFALDFARLDRWGVAQVRESLAAPDPAAGKFPVVCLREVIADLANGWSPKCHPRPAAPDEWGVLKLGAVSYGFFDESANKALPSELSPIPSLEVKPGDTLISRANVPDLVGACAYVESTRPNLMLCDKIFRVVPRSESSLDLRYLSEVLKTPHLRRQIQDAATGASPTMQNITKPSLLALRLPLPPLATQQALVATISAARAEAARERASAEARAATAFAELEAMLLGSQSPPTP